MPPPQKIIVEQVEFKPLDDQCPTLGFRCGLDEIDKWFRRECIKHHFKNRVRVTTIHQNDNPAPIAFYALQLKIERISREERKAYPWPQFTDEFSSIYIYYVAVHVSWQGMGLGRLILAHALEMSYYIGRIVGMPGVTLRAAGSDVARFYEKMGFARFGGTEESPRMLVPMHALVDLFEQNA